jgi:hypothetical protein
MPAKKPSTSEDFAGRPPEGLSDSVQAVSGRDDHGTYGSDRRSILPIEHPLSTIGSKSPFGWQRYGQTLARAFGSTGVNYVADKPAGLLSGGPLIRHVASRPQLQSHVATYASSKVTVKCPILSQPIFTCSGVY